MYEYQLTSGGRATHFVEQVVYGAEFIVSMRRAVDRHQTNENAENSLLLAVKAYVDEAVSPKSNLIKKEQPGELNDVICTNFCSLGENGVVKQHCSIKESCQWLRETVGLEEEIDKMKCQAIEIVLRNIPDQIGARFLLDMKNEFFLEKERIRMQFIGIQEECFQISNCKFFNYVPQSKIMMQEFLKILPKLEKKFNQFNETDFLKLEFPEEALIEIKELSILFADIIEWLLKRETDIDKIRSLLKNTPKSMLDLSEIENRRPSGNDGRAEVCQSKKKFRQDPLLKRIKKFIQNQDSSVSVPVSPISAVSENRRGHYLKELPLSYRANGSEIQFRQSNHIGQKQSRPLKTDYSIPCSTKSNQEQKKVDEDVKISGPSATHPFTKEKYPAAKDEFQTIIKKADQIQNLTVSPSAIDLITEPNIGWQMQTESFEKKSTKQTFDQTDLLTENSNGVLRSESKNNTETIMQDCHLEKNLLETQSKKTSEIGPDRVGSCQSSKLDGNLDSNIFSQAETGSIQTNPAIASSSTHLEENPDLVQEQVSSGVSSMAIDCNTIEQGSNPIEQSVPEKKKIAEMFTQEEFAKLIKGGQPMVYQLNTKERSVGENLRHFEITGQSDTASSSQNSKNHKVIILMGATGSGKSTVINGMINYILGVQWKDPFRFKCVLENSSFVRNEAHSQTDSVTAYTLHHREGMTVPYSITIIDTPGYGDTRGIKQDKEITGCIHRFLTKQEIQIDQIHAICFVAASGNSRLTHTQRYILDSVLSIFGEDVKENIRLLVTFADNATPPVVEACRAAHFPMTSPLAGVMYNKFNSSVLYFSNEKNGTDDLSIDEIFWNMGQGNYKTFFTMLESMNGRDLKSTRQVIENRQLLEQSLPDIEVELEICFDTIEKLENRSLHGNSFERKFSDMEKALETAKAKAMSLLETVDKSGRVLDSVALRSHSSSAVDYLSLIRSRVTEEQRPGYQIRLHTLTELQNLLNENNLEGRQNLPAGMGSQSCPLDKAFAHSSHNGTRSSKENVSSAEVNPTRPETSRQSSTSSRPAATVTVDPGRIRIAGTSKNEALARHGTPIKQSTDRALETHKGNGSKSVDTNRIQSTELENPSSHHYKNHSNYPTGDAENNNYYFPSNTKVISVQLPGLAKFEHPRKDWVCATNWDLYSTSVADKQTDVDYSDQSLSG